MQDVDVHRQAARNTIAAPADGLSGHQEAAWPHHSLLAFFTVLWGANFVLAEVALSEMTPISFSVARFVMGGVGMALLFHWERFTRGWLEPTPLFSRPKLNRADWLRLLVLSLAGATLAPWLGIEGLNLTYAGRAAFWLALAPAVSALFGFVLGTERLSTLGKVGLTLAGAGTLGLALDGLTAHRSYWLGDLLLAAALVLAVAELHLIKPLARRHGAIPMVTLRTMLGGAVYVVFASPSIVRQPWLSLSSWTWVAIVLGGIVGVGIGQWVKVRALRAIGPTQVVIYGNLVPLATLFIGWFALGTTTTILELIAGLLIIIGAYCMQRGGGAVLEREPSVG